jgi:hypothetical protein
MTDNEDPFFQFVKTIFEGFYGPQNDRELRKEIDKVLKRMESDPSLKRRLENAKHGCYDPPRDDNMTDIGVKNTTLRLLRNGPE